MKPTVGRVVHYFDEGGSGPFAGLVCAVRGALINIAYFDQLGRHQTAHLVPQRNDGEDDTRPHTWCWPPREAP